MPQIIIIEKSGSVKELNIKEYIESELYKKTGHKTGEGFTNHVSWKVDVGKTKYNIEVYGKVTGRANQENKYDFPPPIDNTLFFGSCAIVNKTDTNEIANLTNKEWESIYEKLFGGFDDIGSEDSEEEDDEDDDDEEDVPRTKEGYVKDGFIVDDDEEEDEDEEDDEEEYEEEEDDEDYEDDDQDVCKRKRKKNKKVQAKNITKKIANRAKNIRTALATASNTSNDHDLLFDCTSELTEEEYFS